MTKEQLLAEFDKNHPKSQHCEYGFDSFEQGLLCDCKTIERCKARKELESALSKLGAEEYERGRREALESLLPEMIEYIEDMEEKIDGEWGSCRSVAQLKRQNLMPELYKELLALTTPSNQEN